MGKYIVRVVDDNTLDGEGWAMAQADDGDRYFIVEQSAASDPQVLADAWDAARQLEENNAVMRAAVERGHEPGA